MPRREADIIINIRYKFRGDKHKIEFVVLDDSHFLIRYNGKNSGSMEEITATEFCHRLRGWLSGYFKWRFSSEFYLGR